MTGAIRVMVVDDQPMVRAGIRNLLELAGGEFLVDLEASTGDEAVGVLRTERPDVVLMDIRMPALDGISALRKIRTMPAVQHIPVIMLTTFDSDELLFESLEAGAAGFVLKDIEPTDLYAAVRAAHRGDSMLDPSTTRRVITRALGGGRANPDARERAGSLTDRERDVLIAVARGLTNDEIAAELYLSPATVRTYVSRLMARLGCRDRVALTILAYQARLV